jgi:hypothetical protein
MTTFLTILFCVASATAAALFFLNQKNEKAFAKERKRAAAEIDRLGAEAATATANALSTIERKTAELDVEAQRVREHYESESRKIIEEIHSDLTKARNELEPLRALGSLQQSDAEVRATLSGALVEASALQSQAQTLLAQSRQAVADELKRGQRRSKELYDQAEALLAHATRDAGRIVADAETRAQQIGGDAYTALRDKQTLERAIPSLWNATEGYGDRYVVPTQSVLDDLAEGFSHTDAGVALRVARDVSRRMVEQKLAATNNYDEPDRRDRANRFIIDAFNGRVDAILSRTKHNNFGTLAQEIQDAFNLVNLNGLVFRDARILPTYLDFRLAELRWAVVVQELRLKEREEQRRIQEQIREEDKARRDYERAMQEAVAEEEIIRKAMEKARAEAAHANAQDRSKLEAQLAELSQKLTVAEAKNQRALSMAQQTRSGHVYIISNVGSFGEDILKIGMTRRLEPDDRIKELSDASVPFKFDVHAMIRSDDAPALERLLHERFNDLRVNKVNYRKEFFRVPIHQLREFVAEKTLEATFTMTAESREYRETLAFEKMKPEAREKYQMRESEMSSGDE